MSETGGARREGRGADEPLNLAIDLTVRQMLDVEPPAGLRGRVLQRIDGRAPVVSAHVASAHVASAHVASAFRRKILWTSLPLAAAAMLILAIMAPWAPRAPWRTSAPGPVSPPPQIAGVERPAVPGPAASESMGSAVTRPQARTRQDPPRPVAPSAAAATAPVAVERMIVAAALPLEGGVEIDPLAPIDPIRIVPVGPAAIEHKEVVVPPLAVIAQLQTAPLSISDGRF